MWMAHHLQMILDKDSSILGYPGEISQPLNADHHDVCKYSGRDDPNYVTVRSVLKSLVLPYRKAGNQMCIPSVLGLFVSHVIAVLKSSYNRPFPLIK